MTTYGDIASVRIETTTGAPSGVTVGRESYLILIGVASGSTENTNEPIQIIDRDDAVEKFGEQSDITVAYEQAIANEANTSYIKAIRAETTSKTESNITNSAGTLSGDLYPDKSTVTVTDDGTAVDVSFQYGSTPTVTSGSNEAVINPITGEYAFDAVTSAEIQYETVDWSSAIQAAPDALGEGEFGVVNPLTFREEAHTELNTTLTLMRQDELKMAVGLIGTEPNDTLANEQPGYDTTGDITVPANSDTVFSIAGAVTQDRGPDQEGYATDGLGAVSGLFAGNANDDPVYDTGLNGIVDLAQKFTRADISALRDEYVIPVRDTGNIRVADNQSTYDQATEGGWERDFFRRRIVDLVTVIAYRVARQQIGGVLDPDTIDDVEDALRTELESLVDDGLLEEGGQDTNTFREDDRTIGVELEITPFGVAKSADIELEIFA